MSINIEQARNMLSDGRYSQLPKYKKDSQAKNFFKELAFVVKDLTVVLPMAQLIFTFSIAPLYRWSLKSNIRPHMIKPISKKEMQIRQIAKNAGIRDWSRFKVVIGKSFSSQAALHRSTIVLPPEDLIKAKNLPADLRLERLTNNEITETEWVVNFIKWLNEKYCGKKKENYVSQLHIDRTIIEGRSLLASFRNPKTRRAEFEAIIGHELGHCELKHTYKHISLAFALQLLAWPTLGLYKLFYDKALNKLSRKHEREADFYCARMLGKQKDLSSAFEIFSNNQKFLHPSYPKFYTPEGDHLRDKGHPPLSERIRYLKI